MDIILANFLFAFAILFSQQSVNAGVAPFITPCKGADKECIIKSAQAALPKVAAGLPELKVERADPLTIEEATGDHGELKLKFTDITVTGASKCKVVNVERNIKKQTLLFEAECPINMVGDYTASGKLSILPIEGNDKFTINTENIKLSLNTQLETVDGADGKKHWRIASWTHSYEPLKKVHIDLKNLFKGNENLSKPVAKLLNDNWKDVTLEIGQPIVKGLVKKAVDIVNEFMAAVPADELELL